LVEYPNDYATPVESAPTQEPSDFATPAVNQNPSLSPAIAHDRATQADFGLRDKIAETYPDYYSAFIRGQEKNVRNYVSNQLALQNSQRRSEAITAIANKKGGPLTTEEIAGVDEAINDPRSVIEDHYSREYMEHLNWPRENPDTTHWLNQIHPEEGANNFWNTQINLGTEYAAKSQFFKTRQQEAHETLGNQGYFSRGIDILKNLITVYPWVKMHVSGTSWFNLPGHAQDEARDQLLTMPYEDMKNRYDIIYNALPPNLRVQFADNMSGMSTSDRMMQDLFPIVAPGVEVLGIARVAGALSLRNSMRTAVRQQIQSVAQQTVISPAQQAALAAGNIRSSAVQRVFGTLANRLRRGDPIQEAQDKLPNIFQIGKQEATINTGNDINGTNMILERYDSLIARFPQLMQGLTGVERMPALAEKFRPAIEVAQDQVLSANRNISDNVMNLSEPYRHPVTGVRWVDLIIGRSPLETFSSKGEAGKFAKQEGLGGVQFVGDFRRKVSPDILNPDRAAAPFETDSSAFLTKRDIVEGDLTNPKIVQNGSGYVIIKPVPVAENTPGMRSMMSKLDEDRTPKGGIVNSFTARFRTPNETQSAWANRNREAATFVSSNLQQYAWEQLEDIRKMQPLLPFGKGVEKWNDWERVLNNARREVDPQTAKIGRTYRNIGEYQEAYQKQLGRLADDQEVAAYFAFKRVNELDHALRTVSIMKHKERHGVMSQQITWRDPTLPGNTKQSPEFDGVVKDHFPGGKDRIAMVQDDGSVKVKFINKLGNAPASGPNTKPYPLRILLEDKVQKGELQVVELHAPEHTPLTGFGGITSDQVIRYALVPSKMLSNKPLDWNAQLPFRGGGHFVYAHPIRGSQLDIRSDGGKHVLVSSNTGWTFANSQDAEFTISRMNQVRELLQKDTAFNRAAARDIVENQLHDNWNEVRGWFKTPQVRNKLGQYISGSKPRFNLNEPFRIHMANENLANKVPEAEMIARYGKGYEDIRKSSLNQQFMTEFSQERDANEVFTFNNKGTPENPFYNREPSPLVDAIPTMNRAMNKISNSLAMDDMKAHAVETWMQEAKSMLAMDESRMNSSPLWAFHHAEFKKPYAGNAKRIAELEAAREQIKSFIGQVSETDAVIGYWTQKLSDVMYEKTPWLAKRIDPFNLAHTLSDPTRGIRALTTHMKMGLFAIPQILVQGQTYVNILGIAGPTRAIQGTAAALMHQWTRGNASPALIAKLGKHLENYGFKPGEFESMREAMLSTGFHNVGGEYAVIDNPMSNKVIQTNFGKFLDLGMWPFKEGERNVRFGAWYTAAKEYAETTPVSQWSNADKLKVLDRASLLNGNMNRASNATYQRGWAALPVQFMTYTIRQAELFWGKRLTKTEKARLLFTNAMAYGLPVGMGITGLPSDFFKNKALEQGYSANDNYITGMLQEGIPSTIAALIDHDRYWNVGERLGNSGLNDIFYGDKTLWELAGGAAFSSLKSVWEAGDPFRQAIMSGYRQDPNTQFKLQYEHLLRPFREITGFNSAERAIIAANTSNWVSKNGDTLLRGITVPEALVSYLPGLQPLPVADLRHMSDIRKSEKAVQEWAERQAVTEAGRGMRAYGDNDPDTGASFITNALMYLKVHTPEERHSEVMTRMFDRYQDIAARMRRTFGTKDVPPDLEEARRQQWINSLGK